MASTKIQINPLELDFLLRFPTTSNTTSPVDFITNSGWGSLKSLSGMEEFRNLDRDIENNAKRWVYLAPSYLLFPTHDSPSKVMSHSPFLASPQLPPPNPKMGCITIDIRYNE